MPYVAPDSKIREALTRFITNDCQGNKTEAAARLNLEKTLVWRVSFSGCALRRNQEKLREGLERVGALGKTEAQEVHRKVQQNAFDVQQGIAMLDTLAQTLTVAAQALRSSLLVDRAGPEADETDTMTPLGEKL